MKFTGKREQQHRGARVTPVLRAGARVKLVSHTLCLTARDIFHGLWAAGHEHRGPFGEGKEDTRGGEEPGVCGTCWEHGTAAPAAP